MGIKSLLGDALKDSSEMAVVVTDEHGRLTWASKAFERLTGYKSSEIKGRKPGEVLQFEGTDQEVVAGLRQRIRSGLPANVAIQNRRKDGSLYWVRLQILPTTDETGAITGFVGLQNDITQDVQRRLAIEREKDALLGIFSHEVRTPINAIINLIDLVRHTPLNDEQAQWLEVAAEASESLQRLINEVLALARDGTRPQSRPQPVELPALMRRLQALSLGYPRSDGVELSFVVPEGLPRLMLDEQKLFRTLLNLLSNSLKFTEQGSVVLRVEHDPLGGTGERQRLRFSVSDTGIGIAEHDQERILLPFEQADQGSARRHEGSGLGLALCCQMLNDMGSSLDVYSVPGQGSCFSFELMAALAPAALEATVGDKGLKGRQGLADIGESGLTAGARARARAGAAVPEESGEESGDEAGDEAPAAPLAGLNILVVDDNAMGRLVASKQLQRMGACVSVASSGQAALDVLSEGAPFSAVLMDLYMPGMDGHETTRRLRQLNGRQHLPVLALSGAVVEAERQAAAESGMVAFLEKPFEPQKLAQELLRVLV